MKCEMYRLKRSSERRALGPTTTLESKGALVWQIRFILYICREEMVAIQRAAKASQALRLCGLPINSPTSLCT